MKIKLHINSEDSHAISSIHNYFDKKLSEEEIQYHERNRKDPYMFAVTDLTFCPRATYYKKKADEYNTDGLDTKAKQRMVRGQLFDKLITSDFGEMGQVEVEEKFDNGIIIHGRMDGSVDEDTVYELKTIETAYYLSKNKQPTDSAMKQTRIYCAITNKNKAIIEYVAPSDVYTFNITFTDEELNEALEEANIIAMSISIALRGGTLPEKQTKGSWKCKSCQWKKICRGE